MTRLIFSLAVLSLLAACGADGKPLKPTYTTETTIGYNSRTGPFNKTVIGIEVGG